MPAKAGIQEFSDNNNFKYLDSRFRGNDGSHIDCGSVSQVERGLIGKKNSG